MNELIIEIAERVLCHTKGFGRWDTKAGYRVPDNAIKGLRVGDAVYSYDDDCGEIKEDIVSFVRRGVAYIVDGIGHFGPICLEVTEDRFCETRSAAIMLYREAM